MNSLRVMAWIFLVAFLGFLLYVGVWAGRKTNPVVLVLKLSISSVENQLL